MDFATDAWFLAADQKSVELMSGHVRNVYNYLFSQVTRNIPRVQKGNSIILVWSVEFPPFFFDGFPKPI